jgi:hypothetical protein
MRSYLPVLALAGACAAAPAQAERALPTCSGLVPDLQRNALMVRNGLPLQAIDVIVEDLKSTPVSRICTGVAHYPDGNRHVTFTGRWRDLRETSYVVEGHETVHYEEEDRARSLRVRTHPKGMDGTFSVRAYVPYCTDPEFIRLATNELHLGITYRNLFFREPAYKILSIEANGFGSGILANCVAKVGDADEQGAVFLGTDWVSGATERRFQLHILETGPDGWKLKNRLWEIGSE